MPRVNNEILKWARERAGLSLEDAARAVGLTGANAAVRLGEMEEGEREPSRRQLIRMAERYRRPILTFYLPAPPEPAPRTHDFRTLRDRQPGSEALVEALVRNVRVRQEIVRSALQDMEEEEPLPFVGSLGLGDGAQVIADQMRAVLHFDLAAYRAARTVDDAFRVLRDAIEKVGVYVILMGNLGHHTTNIDPRVFRGFALADPVAPFIIINENDARSAWAFTLLHEFAHVLLGQTGISGYDGAEQVEQVCDEAAARFLLQRDELLEMRVRGLPLDGVLDAIGNFARGRKVSRKMVAYNLLKIGRITTSLYQRISNRLDEERADQAQKDGEGGADYYVVRLHRVGRGLTRLVDRMVGTGALTSTKAARVLGVRPTAVGRMTAGAQAA
jgi:Zn-dependent peptidase ImmA (M78 family)/transcriptional regulator with XRE-family HTH domain